MHRNELCLDFTAQRINIDAHNGDDVRFSYTLTLDDEPIPAAEYSVETFIFLEDGTLDPDHNFTTNPQDGVVSFELEEAETTDMGPGNWTYAIQFTITVDYKRSYVHGHLVLTEKGDV